jgi:lipid A 4'-phosphatase
MKAFINSVSPSIWLLFILTSAVWIVFPQIDIEFTKLFYTQGEGFTFANTLLESFLYKSVKYVLIIVNVSAVFLWLYNRFSGKNILDFNAKKLLFSVLVLAIGSGLIVNALLKENWGRPRPAQTVTFGGKMNFTPAFIPTSQDGYSFSCGHASAAFALIAFAMLAKRRKVLWMSLAISYGVAVGLARVAAGGHFLSDVVVSFFIMLITAKMLYYLMFEKKKA